MRVKKEIEVITCDGCGFEIPSGNRLAVTIDGRQWDVCSVCFPKLYATLNFLTNVVRLPIRYSLEAQDVKS